MNPAFGISNYQPSGEPPRWRHRGRPTRSRGRGRWSLPVLVLALAVGLLLPLGATAGHVDPGDLLPPASLPLTQDTYERLYAITCGTGSPKDIEDHPPPDSKLKSDGNNLYTGADFDGLGNVTNLAIWQNGDHTLKETSFEISGQRNVINGDAVARSHLKVSASDTIFAHATEYGTRSEPSKDAFDLSGEDNCFNLEPDQVPRNSSLGLPTGSEPQAPDGFPQSLQDHFDPDGDGNILEHFLPGGSFGFTAASANYFVCLTAAHGGPTNTIPPPLKCDTSSGKVDGTLQPPGAPPTDGVYVASGEFLVNASNLTWRVTAVSGRQLDVSGSSHAEFFPFFRNVLLFASQWDEGTTASPDRDASPTGTANSDLAEDALKTGGSHSLYTGITVATNGRNIASGSQNSWTCPILGDRVTLNGSLLYVSGERCGAPGLIIEKTPDGLADDGDVPDGVINAGDLAVFKIVVTNNGTADAQNVVVTDTLPGTGWTENPDTLCTVTTGANDSITCNVGTLAQGASFTVVLQRSTTTADCAGDTGDGVKLDNGSNTPLDPSDDALANATGVPQANDPGSIIVRCPDVTVQKEPDEGDPGNDVNAGSLATFTITFINNGPGPATGVGTNPPTHDVLPAGLTWSESGGDPDNKCQVVSNVLSCSGISLAAPDGVAGGPDEYSVSVSATTAAANCGTLNNTVTITANGDTNANNNTNAAEIDVICFSIGILKRSTKTSNGNPVLVSNPGALFSVTGPQSFTVKDNNTPTPAGSKTDDDTTVGEVCVDGLAAGTYTVNETGAPAGYGPASQSNVQVVAVAGECGTATVNNAIFTNPPLYDLQVNFRDDGSGETSATITCPALEPLDANDSTAAASGWQTTKTFNNEEAPQVVVCTIDVDP